MIGKVVREFLPKADLLPYLEAILHVYNLSGRRDNKYKARLKILVHEETLEVVRERVEAAFLVNKAQMRPVNPELVAEIEAAFAPPAFEAATRAAADPRRRACAPGSTPTSRRTSSTTTRSSTVSLKPIGGTPGDATAEQMRLVADLAEAYGHDEIRVSHEQNLILPHVPRWHLPEVYARLKEAGLATGNVGLISDIIACPGMDYCALATARSIPIAQEIAETFADIDRQRDIGPLKIKISGCINACGHHHVGHIGILGLDRAGVENYQITLGGDGTETAAIGEKAGHGFAYDEVVPAVERLIEAYLDLRLEPGETFLAGLPPGRHRAVPGGALSRGGAVRCGLSGAFAPARSTGSRACGSPMPRRGRGRARRGLRASSRARWRWSPPSAPRRRCCCNMVAEIDRDLPVLMIDSLMLFPETLQYQRDLSAQLGADQRPAPASRRRRPRAARSRRHAAPARPGRLLRDPQGGAARPGAAALAGDDLRAQALPGGDPRGARGLRVGRRPAQGQSARALEAADIRAYMDAHDLPRHPLVARGYPSIGCAPCTTPGRAGRGRPRRALARQREGRVRHPFRRRRPHPARGELRMTAWQYW